MLVGVFMRGLVTTAGLLYCGFYCLLVCDLKVFLTIVTIVPYLWM